jgi:hypothetical protein
MLQMPKLAKAGKLISEYKTGTRTENIKMRRKAHFYLEAAWNNS